MGRTLQLLVKRSGGKFSPHLAKHPPYPHHEVFCYHCLRWLHSGFPRQKRLLPKLMLMLSQDMDMELFPQQQFLLQCVTLSQKKCARIGPLRPQEKFATPNMMKLLTPPSLNIVKRLSPPSASRQAPRADTALLL